MYSVKLYLDDGKRFIITVDSLEEVNERIVGKEWVEITPCLWIRCSAVTRIEIYKNVFK